MSEQTGNIKIDGTDYAFDQLTPQAKNLLRDLRAVDHEIIQVERRLAICRTAKAAYGRALREELKKTA